MNITNVTCYQKKDPIQDELTNIEAENLVTVQKILIYLTISGPDSEADVHYNQHLLKTVFCLNKLINETYTNLFSKEKIDFDMKLPFKPVWKEL